MTAKGSSSGDPRPSPPPFETANVAPLLGAAARRMAPLSALARATIRGVAWSEVAAASSPSDASPSDASPSGSARYPATLAANARATLFGVGMLGAGSQPAASAEARSAHESREPPEATLSASDRAGFATTLQSTRASIETRQHSEHSERAVAEPLFRSAVLKARRDERADADFIAPPRARSWSVLGLLISLTVVLFVGASLARVEVTAEAPGVLRAPNGLRPIASALAGSITDVLVQAGAPVEAGQIVARLEATPLRASLANRTSELERLRRETEQATARDLQIEEHSTRALEQRRSSILGRIQINDERLEQRRGQYRNFEELMQLGGASQVEGLAAKEALQAASEMVASLKSELALLDLEISDRDRQWQERQSTRRTELARAAANVEEAQSLLAATEVRAPANGRIESLLVAPGSVVEAGALLAHVVPSGTPRSVVAFVSSREIAFVEPGALATVEVQSLPVSEFGIAKARATRVSSDVATASEVQATLGEGVSGAVVRVELSLIDSEVSARMQPHLRSGERVTVRLHRQERRVISLLFDFVRRWLR
jgi:multidrug resistance efflux pump